MSKDKLITVRFRNAHHGYAYHAGQNGQIREKDLPALTDGGYVVLFPGDDGEGNENPLPEDFPARELLFDNGVKTIADAKAMGEAVKDINGIGPKSYEDIQAYQVNE